jgi:hypothetical protein
METRVTRRWVPSRHMVESRYDVITQLSTLPPTRKSLSLDDSDITGTINKVKFVRPPRMGILCIWFLSCFACVSDVCWFKMMYAQVSGPDTLLWMFLLVVHIHCMLHATTRSWVVTLISEEPASIDGRWTDLCWTVRTTGNAKFDVWHFGIVTESTHCIILLGVWSR